MGWKDLTPAQKEHRKWMQREKTRLVREAREADKQAEYMKKVKEAERRAEWFSADNVWARNLNGRQFTDAVFKGRKVWVRRDLC